MNSTILKLESFGLNIFAYIPLKFADDEPLHQRRPAVPTEERMDRPTTLDDPSRQVC